MADLTPIQRFKTILRLIQKEGEAREFAVDTLKSAGPMSSYYAGYLTTADEYEALAAEHLNVLLEERHVDH